MEQLSVDWRLGTSSSWTFACQNLINGSIDTTYGHAYSTAAEKSKNEVQFFQMDRDRSQTDRQTNELGVKATTWLLGLAVYFLHLLQFTSDYHALWKFIRIIFSILWVNLIQIRAIFLLLPTSKAHIYIYIIFPFFLYYIGADLIPLAFVEWFMNCPVLLHKSRFMIRSSNDNRKMFLIKSVAS